MRVCMCLWALMCVTWISCPQTLMDISCTFNSNAIYKYIRYRHKEDTKNTRRIHKEYTKKTHLPSNETIWDIVCASVGFFSQLTRDILASWGLTWGSRVNILARTHVVWFASLPQGHCNTHCNAYCNNCNTLQHIVTRVIRRWIVSSRYPRQSFHVHEYMVCTQSVRWLESRIRGNKSHWYIVCLASFP